MFSFLVLDIRIVSSLLLEFITFRIPRLDKMNSLMLEEVELRDPGDYGNDPPKLLRLSMRERKENSYKKKGSPLARLLVIGNSNLCVLRYFREPRKTQPTTSSCYDSV